MTRIAGVIDLHGLSAGECFRRMQSRVCPGRKPSIQCVESPGIVFGVGSKRPSILDTGRLLIVLDGNIYNQADLGCIQGDLSAIGSIYLSRGFVDCVTALNGDFAIALFDREDQSLWLARDRFGVKPLYYVLSQGVIGFASQPQPLLELPFVRTEVCRRFVALFACSHYRYFDNDPGSSPYLDIFQVPPSHALRFKNGLKCEHRYWTIDDQAEFTESPEDLSERYRALLIDAVAIRLRSGAYPAFTLSGGMDSSSVLATAVRASRRKQRAFSTVYSDPTYDESEDIRDMLAETVETWHEVRIENPDVFRLVEEMVGIHGEPVATATWLSHYLLCRHAADTGVSSLFGGLGGDELNAGEFEHFPYFFADLRIAGDEERLTREIQKWIEYHDHPIYRKSHALVEAQFQEHLDLRIPGRCRPDRNRLLRYHAALNRDFFDLTSFEPVMEHPFKSYLKNRTYQDLTRETIPCCLRAEDRNTTAFSLQNVLPFLDHRLVEFMYRVPTSLKYLAGVTKSLLRLAVRGIVPDKTRLRIKKTGWNAPAHLWFAHNCRDQMYDLIHSLSFRQRGIYNVPEVERLFDEHRRIVDNKFDQPDHMMFFWQLLNLETWLAGIRPLREVE